MALPSIEELEREAIPEKTLRAESLEKQVRITYNGPADSYILKWHAGKGHEETQKVLKAGESVVRPVWQARCWLGPFDAYFDFLRTPKDDVAKRQYFKDLFAAERDRLLNRFDWPRAGWRDRHSPSMEKTGHNRMPDFTVEMLDDAGDVLGKPIRLYELYKIGEYDPEIEQFHKPVEAESADDVRAKYEQVIADKDAAFAKQLSDMNARIAELSGLTTGLAVAVGNAKKPAAKETVPA